MAQSPHPRRRLQKSTTPHISSPDPAMSLRKSTTFSERTGLSSELCDPVSNARYLPRRSPTCLKDLVEGEDAEADRATIIARFLQDVNSTLEGRRSGLAAVDELQVLAVPRVHVHQAVVPDLMDVDKKSDVTDHHHYSDSGIGSSVETPVSEKHSSNATPSALGSSTTTGLSAVAKSISLESSLPRQSGARLSNGALHQIQQRILKPILNKPSLKEYHPLIESIPSQVDDQFITNLRDLEKTFLYLAPKFSLSADSFTRFWDFSIRCLHLTVEYLADKDQRKPSDRPYTNNYFLDLVEQIRRYAEIMARTREKEENGESLDEMDFSPDETIVVEGGLSKNGKPAELVRQKNGKSISLAPEGSRTAAEAMSFKRGFADDDEYDDDVLRSMARRRKTDKPGDVVHNCKICAKEFKRPCDLTKHEKTHSRPFKCSEKSCRFYELGWPTEKERDRHVNDKHSSAPKMYHCWFKPCTYASKRESNCKQHMEKTHNWTYIRSKSNGRKKDATSTSTGSVVQSPPTPFTPFATTPSSAQALGTPESMLSHSPWMQTNSTFGFGDQLVPSVDAQAFQENGRRDSTTTAGTNFTYSSSFSPEQFQSAFMPSPSANVSINSPLFINTNQDMNFKDMNFNVSPMPLQQPTPPQSGGEEMIDFDAALAQVTAAEQFCPDQNMTATAQDDLSLLAGANVEGLYDEGFVDNNLDFGGQDFMLFPTDNNELANPTAMNWFPEPETGGQFGNLGLDGDLFSS